MWKRGHARKPGKPSPATAAPGLPAPERTTGGSTPPSAAADTSLRSTDRPRTTDRATDHPSAHGTGGGVPTDAPTESPRTAESPRASEILRTSGVAGGRAWYQLLSVRLLPGLLVLGGIVYDVCAPVNYTASPFFSAALLLTAAVYSWWVTIGTAAATMAVVALLSVYRGTQDRTQAITETVTIVTVALMALGVNHLQHRNVQQLAAARGVAEAAQRAVLPPPLAHIGGMRVAARYVAAQANARIGGDLYAVQETPFGVRLIVGDVRGKGMGAVEAVAVVIGAFREAAERESSLKGVAARLEEAVRREGEHSGGVHQFEGFTTAVLAELPTEGETLRLLNRGHPAPLLLFRDGRVWEAEAVHPALPLGMSEMGMWPDKLDEMAFPAEATLVLMTDGVTEARDRRGTFYQPAQRLHQWAGWRPEELLDALLADVVRHTGGPAADDIALLAVRRDDDQPEDAET